MLEFELLPADEREAQFELIELEPRSINSDSLHADLKAALGDTVAGVSMRKGCVAVIFTGLPTEQQQKQIESIIAAHNPDQRTPEQARRESDRATVAELTPLIMALDLTKDPTPDDTALLVRWMAAKFRG